MPNIALPHGYRLLTDIGFLDLAAALREALLPVHERLEAAALARHAAHIIDTAAMDGNPRPPASIFEAMAGLSDHLGAEASRNAGICSTSMDITVADDPETGQLYLFGRLGDVAFQPALDDMEILEHYPYWEIDEPSERPAGVTTAEWEERRTVWTRVLRGINPHFPEGMFTIGIGSPVPDLSLLTNAETVAELVPSSEERVTHQVHSYMQRGFASVEEFNAARAELPDRIQRLRQLIQPITIDDLAGVAS